MDSRRDGFRFSRLASFVFFLLALPATAHAMMVTLTHQVGAFDNLYNSQWNPAGSTYTDGHAYPEALGTGQNADVVEQFGSAFNFAPYDFIDVTALGTIFDHSPSLGTDPDGLPNAEDNSPNNIFRRLTVYALIGIWSSNPNIITPLTPFVGDNNPAFFVGSSKHIDIPNVPFAYLFLADNDGIFSDNSGYYDVTIEASVIPLPNALVLLIAGLLPLLLVRRRPSA
jgi:hypothetical protein